jgi:hypothetical protein
MTDDNKENTFHVDSIDFLGLNREDIRALDEFELSFIRSFCYLYATSQVAGISAKSFIEDEPNDEEVLEKSQDVLQLLILLENYPQAVILIVDALKRKAGYKN